MFIADHTRTPLHTVNTVWEYAELLHATAPEADRLITGSILPTIRSLAVLAGRLEKLPLTDSLQAPEALAQCETKALDLLSKLQRVNIGHTVTLKLSERAAQTNTGDGTGKMQKRAKRAQWKQERGIDLTEQERQAILKRVRFQLERENGARDNDSTQIRSHNAEGLIA
jgi:hypothetical protein